MSQFERPNPTVNFPNGVQHKEHPVTNHKQAAIEAAAKALTEIGLYNNEEGLDGPFGGTFIEGPFNTVIPTILHAAEEHIRAMIAKEILDCVDDIPPNGLPYYRDGIYAGMVSAAILIRGPQE